MNALSPPCLQMVAVALAQQEIAKGQISRSLLKSLVDGRRVLHSIIRSSQ